MSYAALGAAVTTAALVLVPRASAAQAGAPAPTERQGEAVWLSFQEGAPAGCPSEAEFKAEVSKLTSKARFIKKNGARRVRIELEDRGGEVFGRFVTGDGKNQSSREIHGKDCREVASALAIAVALTIDPEALGPSEPEPPPPSDPPPLTETPRPQPKPRPKPSRPKPPQGKPVEPKPATEIHGGLGAGISLESAWAPHMRLGLHAFALLGVGERLRLSLGAAHFPTREDDDVSFGAWFGQGSLSVNLALLGILRPYAGVGYEAGAVTASGSGLSTKVEAQRPWHALSTSLGLRFEMESLFLQLGGSFMVPVSRQRYLVSDPFGRVVPVHETPGFGLKQETSLGVFL